MKEFQTTLHSFSAGGQDGAKRALEEAVILPVLRPEVTALDSIDDRTTKELVSDVHRSSSTSTRHSSLWTARQRQNNARNAKNVHVAREICWTILSFQAKAVASEAQARFFNISASSLTSKYVRQHLSSLIQRSNSMIFSFRLVKARN